MFNSLHLFCVFDESFILINYNNNNNKIIIIIIITTTLIIFRRTVIHLPSDIVNFMTTEGGEVIVSGQ